MWNPFKKKETPLEAREIYINAKSSITTNYMDNGVRTTQYTFYNFIFKNLYLQFQRAANVYFLFLIILQLIPNIGNGLKNAIMGMLAFGTILMITMVKDGYEDWMRFKSDKEQNNRQTMKLKGFKNYNVQEVQNKSWFIFSKNHDESEQPLISEKEDEFPLSPMSPNINKELEWQSETWNNLKVGDIIRIHNDESIPADIVILNTSELDGTCFIETKNLDGETNLKVKHSLNSTAEINHIKKDKYKICCEPPNVNLYNFNGTMNQLDEFNNIINVEPINNNNILLRGCILKNVDYIIGIIIYTGHQTKIVLNSGDTKSKKSYIEIMMNKQVIINFIILIILCLIVSIIGALWYNNQTTSIHLFITQFKAHDSNAAVTGVMGFFTSLILFQNIVPISLYLTVEMVKSIQAYFIACDIEMYYEPLDKLCEPKAWNLSDDLGQIEYIFSDKTGTLTQNIMLFNQCSINGIMYGQQLIANNYEDDNNNNEDTINSQRSLLLNEEGDNSFDDRSSTNSDINLQDNRKRMMIEERDRLTQDNYRCNDITFVDPQIYMDIRNQPHRKEGIVLFFKILSLCHTVLVEVDHEHPDKNIRNLIYKAESPDEAALVAGATNAGFTFLSRVSDKVEVSLLGEIKSFQILNVLDFNSTRKRMSIILKDIETNQIVLYCKGADSIILERLAKGQDQLVNDTLNHLKAFAQIGLRTLCIAYRNLDEIEYHEWNEKYKHANNSMEDREDKVMQVNELIEKELILVGGTAIEDKLQEGVSEAIELLRQSGIKIWVLTGDKIETAINIGFSCNLLTNEMELISVNGDSINSVNEQLDHALKQFTFEHHPELALIIDGTSLKFALDKPTNQKLLHLAKQCSVVICCRVSPLQKAQVVSLVKDNLNAMTLAIGDGANDVSMIQAAHIGIGIAGLEGCQAVMSSDYAIAQFRYLTNLLLVHGRWSYIRISHMILCFFYKNLVMTLTNFLFQFFNGPSQTFLFDYTLVLCYNLLFTAFPIMVLGTFDQDVSAEVALVTPQLYWRGIKHLEYSHKRFFMIVLDATYQSLVCFFVPYIMFGITTFEPSGSSNNSLDGFGTTVSACVVVTVNLFVGLWTFNWTFMMYLVIFGSILVYFILVLIFSHIVKDMHSVDSLLFVSLQFWLVLILTIFCCLLPRFLSRYLRAVFNPKDVEIIREQVLLFYNFLRRRKRQLRKQHKSILKKHRLQSEATALGESNLAVGRVFSLKNNRYQNYTGYAFAMDDESVISERLKKTMLKKELEKDKEMANLVQLNQEAFNNEVQPHQVPDIHISPASSIHKQN